MNPNQATEAQYLLARAWHAKGRSGAAIQGYRKVLALQPGHPMAALMLGTLLEGELRPAEALAEYRAALEHHPDEARLHKRFVNLLYQLGDPDGASRYYRLERCGRREISLRPSDLLCCLVLRNELPRLPYYLEYYRRKGVAAFFVVDNGSTDGSLDFLLGQPDVYVWNSDLPFHLANFGSAWFETILRRYGQRHWCVMADADELLYYPDCEHRSLPELCRALDYKGRRALRAIHLDMYSDGPIRDTHYTPGRPFEELCPFFDRRFYHHCDELSGPFRNQNVYWGGVRLRVFREDGYYLSKVPLLRYDEDCILAGGQHWTNLPVEKLALETGALLHFKYFASFCDYVAEEARRKVHSGNGIQYQQYERGLQAQPALTLYDPAMSLKLEDSRQLVRLGVMQGDESGGEPALEFPTIEPVPPAQARPFWSVMLSVYRRTEFLEQALRSVLAQAPDAHEMAIEVVIEGGDPEHQVRVEEMARAIGGDRVSIYRHPVRAGQPEIFNVCLRRAPGQWIHILHDDDYVAPDFYRNLREGIDAAPEVGAAFCRHYHVDAGNRPVSLSFLERETVGIVSGWLERIAVVCRLQTPSMVVRREAYERLGGYCPQARSAFDWEMWQRLAAHYPVWYDPRPLAYFRRSSESESSRLIATGKQVSDTRAAIGIAHTYLPLEKADSLTQQALDSNALWAIELATLQMKAGRLPSAMANLAEAVRCSRSPAVTRKLLALLAREEQVKA